MMDEIDTLVKKDGYPNRSEFLRAAARALLDTQQQKNAITVEMAPLVKEFIDTMVDRGYYRSQAHAVQAAVDSFFTEQRVSEAYKATKHMEIAAGKKVEIDLDNTSSRQIIKP
jgi:Arc/MetJ-type ribon-helix-helix transcriptional regulator